MGLSLLLPGSRVSALLVQGSDPIAMVLRPEGLNLGVVHIPAVELLGYCQLPLRGMYPATCSTSVAPSNAKQNQDAITDTFFGRLGRGRGQSSGAE